MKTTERTHFKPLLRAGCIRGDRWEAAQEFKVVGDINHTIRVEISRPGPAELREELAEEAEIVAHRLRAIAVAIARTRGDARVCEPEVGDAVRAAAKLAVAENPTHALARRRVSGSLWQGCSLSKT